MSDHDPKARQEAAKIANETRLTRNLIQELVILASVLGEITSEELEDISAILERRRSSEPEPWQKNVSDMNNW